MYKCVTTTAEVREYLGSAAVFSFDIETAPDAQYRDDPKAALDPHKANIVGISFSVAEGSGIYVPLNHATGGNCEDIPELWDYLAELFADPTITKVSHNLSFESSFLYARGIVIQAPVYDTIAAAQMTLKSSMGFRSLADSGLKTLAKELLDADLPSFGEVVGIKQFDELDPSDTETIRYACADADFTLRLYHIFNGWFDKWMPRHRYIVEHIESPTAVYCGIMRYNGLPVDEELMKSKAAECERQLSNLKAEIEFIVGDVKIGANCSTGAFKKYLYQDLGLPVLKSTAKYQEAIDEDSFVYLKEWCHANRPELETLFDLVLEYRALRKVYSTYIEGYLKHVNSATGRIHPQLLQLGAESGRFSCRQPNIQNQKSGDTDGVNVRDFFAASEGSSLIELDYSQIEARLAAYLSRDDRLLEIYRENGDLHARTTAAVFGIPFDEASDKKRDDYKHRRTVAKTTFFGFLYGIYAKSLQRNLKLSAGINADVDDCKRFLENLASHHLILSAWQKASMRQARENCYAETALGRRRYVPSIRSTDFVKRGKAERAALNHGVQGLAADLLKLAMARLIKVLPLWIKPLFTVHDSLVFECPDERISEAIELIKREMEVVPPIDGFDVRIVTEASVGKSYGSMEELP